MRMRFKPYAHDELMAADFHVHEPLIWGGKWHAQYARPEQPFVLELGCGKGGFLSQLACAHPDLREPFAGPQPVAIVRAPGARFGPNAAHMAPRYLHTDGRPL